MNKLKFSLIICGYNEEKNLDICIKSCLEQDYPKNKYEIIYVDNNSTDNSLKIAKKYPIKVLIEKKQGLSEARNNGIKNSNGEILVFLDADLKLDKNYLRFHEKTFEKEEVGAGGGKVLPLNKKWVSDYLGVSLFEGYPRYKNYRFVRTYPGCNLTIRRIVIEKVGMFKEGLKSSKGLTRFAEDKEMCERIRKGNYQILYNPNATVYHKNTYKFKKLLKIWIKGSKCRVDMIRAGKKDPFSLLFKYSIPFLGIIIFLLSLLISWKISITLVLLYLIFAIILSIKSYNETGLFFQSFLIKPWMDFISIIIINISILIYMVKK